MRRVFTRLGLFAVLATSVLGLSAVGASAKTSPTPAKTKFVVIKSGTTTITATTSTVTALLSHNVLVTVVKPATMSKTSVTLPVKGGVASTKTLDGTLLHRGAIKFTAASKSVTLRRIALVKLGKKAHLVAVVGGRTVNLGTISGLKASLTGKVATVTGELHLSAAVAKVVNTLAGQHIVSAGYDFGSFTSTLNLK